MTEEEVISAYEDLLRTLVKPLLGDTEFSFKSKVRGSTVHIELRAPSNVRGRVIGRGGRIARSLRTLVETAAIPTDLRVNFDIAD